MRNVFFSFHYRNDIFRVNVVRNAWVAQGGAEPAGYRDRSMWEEARTRSDRSLAAKIARALRGTSVTAVLIGQETADRFWVQHEIVESWRTGKGLIGVRIHGIRCARSGGSCRAGENPFNGMFVEDDDGDEVELSDHVPVYDWVRDDGYANFADWLEDAAVEAGR